MDEISRLIEAGDLAELLGRMRDGALSAYPTDAKEDWARLAARLGRAEMLEAICGGCHGMSYPPDAEGGTILHHAARSGDPATMAFAVRVLGFSADEGDDRGVTPLDLAREKGADALRALEKISGIRLRECYRNPVIRGMHPDPSILRVGEDYWLINSTFTMMPALEISHSRDLVHWETAGHVFTDPAEAGVEGLPGGYGYWAPDISFYQGRYWVVATLRRDTPPYRIQMITSAEDPRGPWAPPRFLPADGIDPSLFTDADGKRYLVVNPGVRIARISDGGEMMEEPRMIWMGTNRYKSEGPHIIRKDGWYYIFQAEGGTGNGHMISCARARHLEGPYEHCPFNPILGGKRRGAYIARGGHGKPFQLADGRWAIVYLCGRRIGGKSLMGRETALDPLEWTADGWPMVNGLRGPSCLQRKLLPDAAVEPGETDGQWLCPREDWKTFARIRENGIALDGGAELSGKHGAHLLLRRQTESRVEQRADVDVSGMAEGGEAGLTGYYDEDSWYMLSLRRTAQGAEVLLRERIGEERRETRLGLLSGTRATLRIRGEGLEREAGCAETGETARLSVGYLADEGLPGKRFTGACLGLAAVGRGEARFENIGETMTE